MSRSRKRTNPRKSTRPFQVCPRHGYCSWCDRGRQHQALAAEEHTQQDLDEVAQAHHWADALIEADDE